jgi:hypothetical protein
MMNCNGPGRLGQPFEPRYGPRFEPGVGARLGSVAATCCSAAARWQPALLRSPRAPTHLRVRGGTPRRSKNLNTICVLFLSQAASRPYRPGDPRPDQGVVRAAFGSWAVSWAWRGALSYLRLAKGAREGGNCGLAWDKTGKATTFRSGRGAGRLDMRAH